MIFKKNIEKNPNRCRVLRQNERQIVKDQRGSNASFTSAMNEVKDLRAQRGDMKDRAIDLGIQIVGATLASGGSGPLGSAIGVSASTLSIQLEVLKSNIIAVEKQINDGTEKIKRFTRHKDRLMGDLKQNADELKALNCVV